MFSNMHNQLLESTVKQVLDTSSDVEKKSADVKSFFRSFRVLVGYYSSVAYVEGLVILSIDSCEAQLVQLNNHRAMEQFRELKNLLLEMDKIKKVDLMTCRVFFRHISNKTFYMNEIYHGPLKLFRDALVAPIPKELETFIGNVDELYLKCRDFSVSVSNVMRLVDKIIISAVQKGRNFSTFSGPDPNTPASDKASRELSDRLLKVRAKDEELQKGRQKEKARMGDRWRRWGF